MFKSKLIWIPVAAVALSVVLVGSATAVTPDTTPPTIAWQNTDMSGVVVNGRLMTVSVLDDTGVTAVEFDINGSLYADGADNGDGTWSAEFDTATYPEGPVTIDAVASDATGNQATASISFTDSHDTEAPTLNSTGSADGSVVSRTLPFNVNVSDNVGVTSVSYMIDDEDTWHDMSPLDASGNYMANIDTTSLENGPHYFSVRMTDAAGNVTIGGVMLDVENQVAPWVQADWFDIGNLSHADPNATPEVGDVLGVSGGHATGSPDPTISYAWRACHPVGFCYTGTGPEYTVQAHDVGADITVTVTADNGVIRPAWFLHDFGTVPAPVVDTIPSDGGPQSSEDPAPASVSASAPTAPAASPAAPAPAVSPATSSKPATPSKPAKRTKPAKKSAPAKPAKSIAPTKSTKPTAPAKPAKPTIPAKPTGKKALPAKRTTPAKPTAPAKPTVPAKPTTSAKGKTTPATPVKSSIPVKGKTKPAAPAKPSIPLAPKPSTPAKRTTPAKGKTSPAAPVKSSIPVAPKPSTPAKPTPATPKPATSTTPTTPAKPKTPTTPTKPTLSGPAPRCDRGCKTPTKGKK